MTEPISSGSIPLRERRALSEEWSEFARLIIPKEAPPMQVIEMQRAWYAGAAGIFSLISGGLDADHEPTDLDVEYLDSLHQELGAFARDLERGSDFGSNIEGAKQEPFPSLDTARIEFLDRLTPRQAALLHYMWSLSADALTADTLMFDTRIRWLTRYLEAMRSAPEGQRQIDQITARVTNLAWQLTPAERSELHVQLENTVDAERKCIRCGCSDARACPGGCSWITKSPPVCSRCA